MNIITSAALLAVHGDMTLVVQVQVQVQAITDGSRVNDSSVKAT